MVTKQTDVPTPTFLTLDTLHEQVATLTGTAREELSDPASLLERLPQIEAELQACLVGQKPAVAAVLGALRARLLRESAVRPMLNLLCVGPSGVGKTATAVQLARLCFGGVLHRFDGGEYAEEHAIARLLGAPPGYAGYGSGGQLTEAVRRLPRSVVLFDEIEKCAPTIRQALLGVLDAGRLTDASGQTVDFRRTAVICTSNLGSASSHETATQNVQSEAQFNEEARPDPIVYEGRIRRALSDALPPEFLARFDAIVVYRHLDRSAIERIVRLKLEGLGADVRGVAGLEASDAAVRALACEADVPEGGAREVERVLRRRLDPGLDELLRLRYLDANQPVGLRLDYEESDYVISTV